MKNLNEILNEIRENEMELLYSEECLKNTILKDIDRWLEEEKEKQDYLEEKFRNK